MPYTKAFCNCLRELCQSVDDLTPIPETNIDQLISASIGSLIEQSEAVISLLDNGYYKSPLILIRSISETAIHLINLCYRGQDYVDLMIMSAHEEMRSMYQFIIDELNSEDSSSCDLSSQLAHHTQKRDKFKKKHNFNSNKLDTKAAFKRADEFEQYLTYKQMCGRTHADITSLIRDHIDSSNEFVIKIGDKINTRELEVGFLLASELLITSFLTSFEYFNAESSHLGMALRYYDSMKSEFDDAVRGGGFGL